jgi:predicted nucleic acid-binding Zn ribbon protein
LAVKARATHALDHVEERGWVTNQHGTFPIKSRSQRRTAPKPERVCVLCGADIPATMRRDARFCSSGCRVTSFKRQRREQTGQAPQP